MHLLRNVVIVVKPPCIQLHLRFDQYFYTAKHPQIASGGTYWSQDYYKQNGGGGGSLFCWWVECRLSFHTRFVFWAQKTPRIDTSSSPPITVSCGTARIYCPTGVNTKFPHVAGVLGYAYAIVATIVYDGMIFPDGAMYNVVEYLLLIQLSWLVSNIINTPTVTEVLSMNAHFIRKAVFSPSRR